MPGANRGLEIEVRMHHLMILNNPLQIDYQDNLLKKRIADLLPSFLF